MYYSSYLTQVSCFTTAYKPPLRLRGSSSLTNVASMEPQRHRKGLMDSCVKEKEKAGWEKCIVNGERNKRERERNMDGDANIAETVFVSSIHSGG